MTDTNETVQDVLRDMRQWKGDYSVFADRIEQSLSAGASGGGEVADVIWRIDNEATQFVDEKGMIYLRYLRGLLTPASPATGQKEHDEVVMRNLEVLLRDNEWGLTGRWDEIVAKLLGRLRASPATGEDKRHVGDSQFESWYADYCRTDWPDGTKQIARDAYAAGMGDATPQPESARGEPRAFQQIRYAIEHCASCCDEGEDFAVSRPMLDALVTLGLMKKVGRGRWGITEDGERLAAAPQPQQAPAQADDAAEQYRQAHNAGEAHGRGMAALEAATPPAHGDGEGPPLPRAATTADFGQDYYTADQMREYARLALTTRPTPEAQEARDGVGGGAA